ncbi:MAG TPA: D-alanyl-D-alanine carboxypeptidase [Acidimicrobiia bacterium]
MARRAGRVLVAFTCCLTALLGAGRGVASALPTPTTAPPIPPQAWIVADAGTGEILAAANEHTALRPASTSKVMTAITAVERLPLDATITVSALAESQPASKINMKAGQRWTLQDALASLLVVSANDAAYAIAEATSGSVAAFAKAEATTGRQLGMKDSTFADPAGLDDGNAFRGGPLMSAYDLAISTRNALRVPALAHLAASASVDFTGPDGPHHLVNHNKLVSGHLYAGANGFKTGFTNKAGHTLIATATRNGRTLIAVVLNTWDAYGWAEHFLDVGFAKARGTGTGTALPAPQVTTYSARAAQFAAFRHLAPGSVSGATAVAATNPRAPSTSAPASTQGRTVNTALASGAKLTGKLAAATVPAKSGGGVSASTILLLVLFFVLATLYVLRVRAVRRARARRLARRRATQSMMRRGSLPIVDGRYRTGTRVGKPVESHVQIHQSPDSGDARASG